MTDKNQFADIFVTVTDKDGNVLGQRNIFQQGFDAELAEQVLKSLDNSFNVFTDFGFQTSTKEDSDWLANVP